MKNKQYIKFYRYIRLTGTTASFLLFLFATLVCFPFAPKSSNLAEAVNPPVESESTIAMVVGKSSASLSLTPSNPTGSFASSSTEELASFDVTTNNYTGYTLNIAASDDNGKLINSTTDTSLDSIDSVISESTFDNTLYNGKWGYNPSKYNSTENTSFRPSPTSDGSTLNVTKCANGAPTTTCPDNQTKDNYTIGLGARADLTTKYGTYSNTFVLTAVGNPVSYVINYTDISGDTDVTNMPDADSATSASTKVAISSRISSRGSKYTFAGWCDEAPTINADGSSTCSGTVYQPSTESTPSYVDFINQTTELSTITLYTTWNINSYLQTVEVRYQNADGSWTNYETYDTCTKTVAYGETHSCSIDATTEYQAASLASYIVTGAATKQIDVYRNTYTVSISDSNTTSGSSSLTIRYGGSSTVTVTPNSGYYLSGVSCPSGYTCSGYSTGSSYTGTQTVTVKNNNNTSGGTLSFTGTLSCQSSISGTLQAFNPCSSLTGSGTLTDSRDNQSYTVKKLDDGNWWMINNLNLTAPTVDLTSSNTNLSTTVTKSTFTGWKKTSGSATLTAGEFIPVSGTDSTSGTAYGTLYNYCAASAGTICTDSNSSDATYDICPKGWRLPTGGSSGEFQALYNNSSYNSNAKMRASIANGGAAFALAGSFYGSTAGNQGSTGFYWSSTRSNDTSMYFLRLYTAYVDPAVSISRSNGISIRCIIKRD